MNEKLITVKCLGSGNAFGLPNWCCPCQICSFQKSSNDPRDQRMRSSLLVEGESEKILIDCGPDISMQAGKQGITELSAVLLTHSHYDHVNGLDYLKNFQRAVKKSSWKPLPTYATKETWEEVKRGKGFSYLSGAKEEGKVLEEKIISSGRDFVIGEMGVVPFATYHGSTALGSVGYILNIEGKKIVYTSDFSCVKGDDKELCNADLLILETNWFNEPLNNECAHMSLQKGIAYIKRWKPKETYLIHFSDEDMVDGDSYNEILSSKRCPMNRLPYDVPKTHLEWEKTAEKMGLDYNLPPIRIMYDGLEIRI